MASGNGKLSDKEVVKQAMQNGDFIAIEGADYEAFYNPDPSSLDEPLLNPSEVYDPKHCKFTRTDDGEYKFKFALGTARNLAGLLEKYKITLKYNEIARSIEMNCPFVSTEGDLSGSCMGSIIEDVCKLNKFPHTQAAGHFPKLASDNTYNPVADWVDSQDWDGEERIQSLFQCLSIADKSRVSTSYLLFRKWILGAVAIALDYTDKFENVLVLIDVHGGIGKTRFFNTLCPEHLRADGVILDPHKPDSVFDSISKWLVELGEIDGTFRKSDMETLKAFLSRNFDEIRRPYQREAARFKRRTAFFGSVNSADFLLDDTNNRRFWPIEVTACDYEHEINMQQVWAEACYWIEHGETWHLDKKQNELIGEYNQEHRHQSTLEEEILLAYDPAADCNRKGLTCAEILKELGYSSATISQKRQAGKLLRKMFESYNKNNLIRYKVPYPQMQGDYGKR